MATDTQTLPAQMTDTEEGEEDTTSEAEDPGRRPRPTALIRMGKLTLSVLFTIVRSCLTACILNAHQPSIASAFSSTSHQCPLSRPPCKAPPCTYLLPRAQSRSSALSPLSPYAVSPSQVYRAWCKQCLPGRRKTRRAPSRHCRDAKLYSLNTTVTHAISTPPPYLGHICYSEHKNHQGTPSSYVPNRLPALPFVLYRPPFLLTCHTAFSDMASEIPPLPDLDPVP